MNSTSEYSIVLLWPHLSKLNDCWLSLKWCSYQLNESKIIHDSGLDRLQGSCGMPPMFVLLTKSCNRKRLKTNKVFIEKQITIILDNKHMSRWGEDNVGHPSQLSAENWQQLFCNETFWFNKIQRLIAGWGGIEKTFSLFNLSSKRIDALKKEEHVLQQWCNLKFYNVFMRLSIEW